MERISRYLTLLATLSLIQACKPSPPHIGNMTPALRSLARAACPKAHQYGDGLVPNGALVATDEVKLRLKNRTIAELSCSMRMFSRITYDKDSGELYFVNADLRSRADYAAWIDALEQGGFKDPFLAEARKLDSSSPPNTVMLQKEGLNFSGYVRFDSTSLEDRKKLPDYAPTDTWNLSIMIQR